MKINFKISISLIWVIFFISCKSYHTNNVNYNVKQKLSLPFIQPGDTIMYVAPAGYVDSTKKYMPRADSLLKSWGFHIKYPKNLYQRHYTFAGTDEQRLQQLQNALDDPNVKIIWCARGGYGSVRIIDKLNFTEFKKHPKWLIGFSDITVLHSLLHKKGYPSVHALMPISLEKPNPDRKKAIQSFHSFLKNKSLSYQIPSSPSNITGKGKGEIVGGNISLLVSLLGSKYQINTDNKILFLEDVGEYVYSYDRMIYALKNAGYFDHLQALIIGGIGIKKDHEDFGENIEEIILKHVKEKGYPVIFKFPAGHIVDNRTLIFGKKAKVKVKKDSVYLKY